MLIIFDLDGTLLNTIADLGEACNVALSEHHYPTHPTDEYPRLVGNGVNKLIERALPEGHKDTDTILRLRETFVAYYDQHNCVHTCPYEGIPDLLAELKKQGHTLAVASNKYQSAAEKIVTHYFPGTFDIIFGERSGCPRKPDPQIVKDIMEMAGLGAEHKNSLLYVGDSDVDIATARNAGVKCVACTWGFCTREALESCKPDFIVNTPQEIASILDN